MLGRVWMLCREGKVARSKIWKHALFQAENHRGSTRGHAMVRHLADCSSRGGGPSPVCDWGILHGSRLIPGEENHWKMQTNFWVLKTEAADVDASF
jgi:hypothetical protein